VAKAPATGFLTMTAIVAVFALCISAPARAESAAHPPSAVDDHAAPAAGAHADPVADAHAVSTDGAESHEAAPAPVEGVKAQGSGPSDGAGRMETLEPYQLMRSLQLVQDAVVGGDHSAMEMQRYLLGVIDERLRAADQSVFDDPRNVDAALVYAMSGGNPATLDLLAIRDRFGNFDSEVTTVLRAYLDGRAATTKTSLADLVKLYRNETIAPYLTLIAANVTAGMNEEASLELFDWARLTAPGTLVEESALRRSLLISAKKGLIEKAVHYASLYARRFINSPYAGQYADLLVDLVVSHHEAMGTEKLEHVLSFMDAPRQREVYLRISRRAAIAGNKELALFAAGRAEALSDAGDPAPAILANFYSSLADVTSGNVDEVAKALAGISDDTLSARDAALKNVARLVAEEVMRAPDPNSLTQGLEPSVEQEAETSADPASQADLPGKSGEAAEAEQTPEAAADTEFQGYLDGNRKIIEEIDSLLDPKDEAKGS
jgi:chemotaxis protein MotC